jgi:hypothetical protein
VNVGPAKTFSASTKSMPWSLRFCRRFASSHSNCIYEVYIQSAPNATRILRPANDKVERHAAVLSQPKLLYPDSSIPSDGQRSHAACPLQSKLGANMHFDLARFGIINSSIPQCNDDPFE